MKEFNKYFIIGTNSDALHDTMNGTVTGELIRCKDCVYFEGKPNGYCSMWSDDYLTKYRTDDDYCSDAERKESS